MDSSPMTKSLRRNRRECTNCGVVVTVAPAIDPFFGVFRPDESFLHIKSADPDMFDSFINVVHERRKTDNSEQVSKAEAVEALCAGELTGAVCGKCNEAIELYLQHEKESVDRRKLSEGLEWLMELNENASTEQLQERVKEAEAEEEALQQELATLQEEHTRAQARLKSAEGLAEALDQEFKHCDRLLCAKELQDFFQNEIAAATTASTQNVHSEVKMIKETRVLSALFPIVIAEGRVPTINNLRLEWSEDNPVEWSEFNAALGTACQCLESAAVLCRASFRIFRPSPNGSNSHMETLLLNPQKRYPLFLNAQTFQHTQCVQSFDAAISAFVTCVGELAHFTGLAASLPYTITDDLVMGMSLHLTRTGPVKWTQAAQYLFQSLKKILDHISIYCAPLT
eukprot:NODE_646_length_1462_cov_311.830856_g486_i0.p1 GENE.NODE_646_length_1462_cov_311.830856_g486_i0~~NODE_646_length_1462_cov_311.830856_g486_i0.p1  ORF type:complete len:398 (+),score=95.45 NODE_646_length_1462_cov_311.830856_g486_i0:195-1388(+)